MVDVEVFGHGVEAGGSGSAGNERWNRGARPGCAGVSRITVGLSVITSNGDARAGIRTVPGSRRAANQSIRICLSPRGR
ncbi:hypothetical protein A8D95_17115 [Burkholderia cenocepacia]|uniref:Uncharacterized protein n=1 Tax=Burkholderia cenocepacia TaxID=95486 RepID=A0A1V2VZX9_9BURK|nr:hypothetical protein A8D83_24175 [Burkholderia cenocepacia]ONJ21045.1 hypothetical protein A8D90_19055 [Burkholderia cenocepacia]ONP20932.1 hypothetical protein A8D84_30420 [Burkholderia cenocepacia]ONP30074.1 hypothetical protein A8D86_32930 [Burkholderia cenocepacia]ONP32588.1 hypothetical protein A8D85_29135 [Burkholderia cenocepacia]